MTERVRVVSIKFDDRDVVLCIPEEHADKQQIIGDIEGGMLWGWPMAESDPVTIDKSRWWVGLTTRTANSFGIDQELTDALVSTKLEVVKENHDDE